jgi:hypothetical protein
MATTAELRAALQHQLSRHFGRPCTLTRLERRPSVYRTSFPLEELDLTLGDGTDLQLLFKDLNRQALTPEARRVKPAFLHEPLREIEVYQRLLAPAGLGTATCYGAVVDPAAGRYWLFLEKVPGVELYQVGDFTVWEEVARWLAGFHAHFARQDRLRTWVEAAYLRHYTADEYRLWIRRAVEHQGQAGKNACPTDRLVWLAERYETVVERLVRLPATLIHGEFYASNVLTLARSASEGASLSGASGWCGVRVCPVDWEMAALGPGLLDLAALTAGKWDDGQRTALARAYHAALAAEDGQAPGLEAFLETLDCCRLHLAIGWLGWSPEWSPPAEHAWDWRGEALHLAEKLRL